MMELDIYMMGLDICTVERFFVVGSDGTLSVSGRAESQSHKWAPGGGGVKRAGFFETSKIRQTPIQTLDKPGKLRHNSPIDSKTFGSIFHQRHSKEIKMTNVIALPSFDNHAKAILKGWKTFDKAQDKLSTVVTTAMQQFVDTWAIQVGKDEKSVKAMGKAIRDSQIVIDAVATGQMEKKTFTEYAQSAMRALHYGVEFSPALKNDETKKLPFSKKAPSANAKAGKVTSTTRAELDKTISKALHQARLIGLEGFAADLIDLCTEALADFKEIKE